MRRLQPVSDRHRCCAGGAAAAHGCGGTPGASGKEQVGAIARVVLQVAVAPEMMASCRLMRMMVMMTLLYSAVKVKALGGSD